MRKGKTKLEAAREWVAGFNAVQHGMIERLMSWAPDEWTEVTAPAVGDRVYVYEVPAGADHSGDIVSYDPEEEAFGVELDSGERVLVGADDLEVERYDGLPMWGTLWSFGDSADDWWLEEGDGDQVMSDCGFRIYSHEEFGFFFGIDGAGYDFYEAHWLPLYEKRGLQWHDPELEEVKA